MRLILIVIDLIFTALGIAGALITFTANDPFTRSGFVLLGVQIAFTGDY